MIENADRFPDTCFCSDPNAPYCRVHPNRSLTPNPNFQTTDEAMRSLFPAEVVDKMDRVVNPDERGDG